MQKELPKVGVGVVVVKDNFVLLGKRKGAHGADDWSTPGGHLELFESPEECAYRELKEETDLEASCIIPGPWTNNVFNNEKHYITLFMFVPEFEGTPKVLEPHKCESWEWHDWDNLPQPLFFTIQSLIETVGIEKLKNQSFKSLAIS